MARQIIPIKLPKNDLPKNESPKTSSVVENMSDIYGADVYNELLGGGRTDNASKPMVSDAVVVHSDPIPSPSVKPKKTKRKAESNGLKLTNVRLDPTLKRDLMLDTTNNGTNLKTLIVTLCREYFHDAVLHDRIVNLIENGETAHKGTEPDSQTNLEIDADLKLLLKIEVANNETSVKALFVALCQEYLNDPVFHDRIITIIKHNKANKKKLKVHDNLNK